MGIGFIIIGLVFLLNPMISVLDVFPDFIGYLFIFYGIYKIADLASELKKAYKPILWLIIMSISKYLIFVLLSGDRIFVAAFIFVFSIFETWLMIYVIGKVYDGFDFLAMNYTGSLHSEKAANARICLIVFAVIRAVFNLIPELYYISTTNYEGTIYSYGEVDIGNFLLLTNVVIVTVMGLIWLYVSIKYILAYIADKEFIGRLSFGYNELVANNKDFYLIRRILVSLTLFIAGIVFLFDFYIDGIDFIPDFAAGLFIIAAFYILRKDYQKLWLAIYFSAAYTIISLITWIINFNFYMDIYYSFRSADRFILILILTIICSGILIYLIYRKSNLFKIYISDHMLIKYEEHFKNLNEAQINKQKKLFINEIIVYVISILTVISKIFQVFCLQIWGEYWIIRGVFQIEYWMIHGLLQIIWMTAIIFFILNLIKAIKFKYEPEEIVEND
ncbi:MAG: hypothetical protein FWF15_02840 [Oscillospiraceae bacterium]|nr:hypothetical protein [Oscillospiraceae bacterium]